MIITKPHEFNVDALFVDLRPVLGCPLFLKCEGFNFAGSIKLKAAIEIIESMERDGRISSGVTLVESSSGNMGVALSMVAASKGYPFVCVTDTRCTTAARRLMETFGAQVYVVSEPDPVGGLLAARWRLIGELCAADDRYVWLNQYANDSNWWAHYGSTGPEILKAFPELDVLFVGAGTTGTLMGCARFLQENRPAARIVAVDTVGSVTFGGPPARRLIPGLGTSTRPQILDESYVDEVVLVREPDTVRTCHALLRRGFLFGGSTGTVVRGAMVWLARTDDRVTAVAISPDLGGPYVDTVYDAHWLADAFGDDLVGSPQPALPPRPQPESMSIGA
jgi:2,3-diaminopropionate biosynthesis protein SbnA